MAFKIDGTEQELVNDNAGRYGGVVKTVLVAHRKRNTCDNQKNQQ